MGNDYNKIKANNNMDVSKQNSTNPEPQTNERPKLQSVVGAAPKKVHKSLLSRLITGVVGPEGVSGIGGYVSEEIIKPAVKNILYDAITSSISMVLFGDRGAPSRGRSYGNYSTDNRPRTNYGSAYQPRPTGNSNYGREPLNVEQKSNVVSRVSRYGVEDYIIEDRHDAAHVLTTLTECADRYGLVSVADYYDLIKADSTFTDNSYGWRYDSIVTARIVPHRGGFVIKFPPVEVL